MVRRCDACDAVALEGEIINAALLLLTQKVLGLPRVLSPDEAKFLRLLTGGGA